MDVGLGSEKTSNHGTEQVRKFPVVVVLREKGKFAFSYEDLEFNGEHWRSLVITCSGSRWLEHIGFLHDYVDLWLVEEAIGKREEFPLVQLIVKPERLIHFRQSPGEVTRLRDLSSFAQRTYGHHFKLFVFFTNKTEGFSFVCVLEGLCEKGQTLRQGDAQSIIKHQHYVPAPAGSLLVQGVVCKIQTSVPLSRLIYVVDPNLICKRDVIPLEVLRGIASSGKFDCSSLTQTGKNECWFASDGGTMATMVPTAMLFVYDQQVLWLRNGKEWVCARVILPKLFQWKQFELPLHPPALVLQEISWSDPDSQRGNWVLLSCFDNEQYVFLTESDKPVVFATNCDGSKPERFSFAQSAANIFYSKQFCFFVNELQFVPGDDSADSWWTSVRHAFLEVRFILEQLKLSALSEAQWQGLINFFRATVHHSLAPRVAEFESKCEEATNRGQGWDPRVRLKNSEVGLLYYLWECQQKGESVSFTARAKSKILVLWSTRLICDSCSELFVNFRNWLSPSRIVVAVTLIEAKGSPIGYWNQGGGGVVNGLFKSVKEFIL